MPNYLKGLLNKLDYLICCKDGRGNKIPESVAYCEWIIRYTLVTFTRVPEDQMKFTSFYDHKEKWPLKEITEELKKLIHFIHKKDNSLVQYLLEELCQLLMSLIQARKDPLKLKEEDRIQVRDDGSMISNHFCKQYNLLAESKKGLFFGLRLRISQQPGETRLSHAGRDKHSLRCQTISRHGHNDRR